jgi:photosystem II stability/assembly factor-like uncharacterized protein
MVLAPIGAFAAGDKQLQREIVLKLAPKSASAEQAAMLVRGMGKVETRARDHSFVIVLKDSISPQVARDRLLHQPGVLGVQIVPSPDEGFLPNSVSSVTRYREHVRERAEKIIGSEDEKVGEEKGEEKGTAFLDAYRSWLYERAFPFDMVDMDAYDFASGQRDGLAAATIARTVPAPRTGVEALEPTSTWNFVGPRNLDVPYRIYYGIRPLAGRVNTMAISPADSNTVYVGTAGGGVWKTTDGGVSYTPLSDSWTYLLISSLAVDPSNTNVVYAGTGDYHGYGRYAEGLKKTTDGGTTWTQLSLPSGTNVVTDIIVDPETPTTVTVSLASRSAVSGGIYRSTDGGSTWSNVGPAANIGELSISALDRSSNRTYYGAGPDAGGYSLYKSTDRGSTWTPVATPTTSGGAPGIATSPVDPLTVYFLNTSNQRIYKSLDGGANWSDITAGFPGGYNWSQAWYDWHINVSRNGSNDVIYVGLIDLVQSPDGGATWRSVGLAYTWDSILHNDQHCMAIDPNDPNKGMVGGDGGVFRFNFNPTNDTWSFDYLSAEIGITQFYWADYHPTNKDKILGGTQDNASPYSDGDLANWKNPGAGDGFHCYINTLNPLIQYNTYQFGGLIGTSDGWASNYDIFSPSDSYPFRTVIAGDPSQPQYVYLGGRRLHRYNEDVDTWSASLGGQDFGSTVRAIAIAPTDSNRIYVGANNGTVWMSTNFGVSWTQIQTGSPGLPLRVPTQIHVNPTNPNEILVTVSGTGSGHLFICGDTTAAVRVWNDVSGSGATGLPDIPANSVERDYEAPATTWYVANDVGVFMTTDSGATWTNATQPLGLPNVQASHLKYVKNTRFLNVATYGRGIWRAYIPLAGDPSSVTLDPSTVVDGQTSTGTVTLSGSVAVDTIISLSSSDPAATVPASVTVTAGNSSAEFEVTTSNPGVTAKTADISATYDGVTKSATLTINPPPTLASVTLNPEDVLGGSGSTGTVTLASQTYSDVTVNLTSSSAFASLPATVVIPAGSASADFVITTDLATPAGTIVLISAEYNGVSASAYLGINAYDDGKWMSQIVPTQVRAGQTFSVTLVFENRGGSVWTLSRGYKLQSQDPTNNVVWGLSTVALSASDAILPGQQKTFTFNVTAPAAPGKYSFQWQMLHEGFAKFGSKNKKTTINVVP